MKEIYRGFRFNTKPVEVRRGIYRKDMVDMAERVIYAYQIPEKLFLVSDRKELFRIYFAGYLTGKFNYDLSIFLNDPRGQVLLDMPGVGRLFQPMRNELSDKDAVAEQLMEEGDLKAQTIKDSTLKQAQEYTKAIFEKSIQSNKKFFETVPPKPDQRISAEQLELINKIKSSPEFQAVQQEFQDQIRLLIEEKQDLLLREDGTPEAIKNAANLISNVYVHTNSSDGRASRMEETINSIMVIGK